MTSAAPHAPRPLTSPLLAREGFSHAFFTREGGVSAPPFDTLNFATSNGDAESSVRENLRRAAHVLGAEVERLYFLSQVHGTAVERLAGGEARDEVVQRRGDVTLSTVPGVACGVRVADCVPVLVGDRRSGAVAAIHSGWQGTVLDVVRAAVVALREAIGENGDLVAAIGPHIERCCFEVGDDVAAKLAACAPGEAVVDRTAGTKPHIDLRRIVRAQLRALDVADEAIDDVSGCTKCDPTRFFSYRRDRAASGRHLAAIAVRAPSR